MAQIHSVVIFTTKIIKHSSGHPVNFFAFTETISASFRKSLAGLRPTSTLDTDENRKDMVYTLIDNINRQEDELAELLGDLNLLDDYEHILCMSGWELDDLFSGLIGHRNQQALEARVRMARQKFGGTVPEGHLNAIESKLYECLYGAPIITKEESKTQQTTRESHQLHYGDGADGFEEVEFQRSDIGESDISEAYDLVKDSHGEEHLKMRRSKEIAEQLGGVLMMEQFEEDEVADATPRVHPLTQAGKFSTDPGTIFLPKDTLTGPISAILSNFSNKHIAETAHRSFGGQWLPHSTMTPPSWAQIPQLPIPLYASQHNMGEMEANAYIAALFPGVYASVMSVLVEVRKRLGSDWIRQLICQDGGPRVLDVGGGGAGVLAWRDVIRAECELVVPDRQLSPIPLGKSTVITGSEALRHRASLMLENTTFLPRLPNYVHVRDSATLDDERAPPKRKQYDIIIVLISYSK